MVTTTPTRATARTEERAALAAGAAAQTSCSGQVRPRSTRRRAALFVAAALLLGLPGCRSTPARFYVLTAAAPGAVADNAVELALAPVVLPSLLDRPQLVTVDEGHRRSLDEDARWAEQLGDNVTDVLAENLSRLLATERIVRLPAVRREPYEHVLHVEVLRFDARPGVSVELEARWTLEGAEWTGAPPVPRRASVSVALDGDDDEAVVAGMSAALLELSRVLAGAIEADGSAAPGGGEG